VELDHARAGRHTYTGVPVRGPAGARPCLGPAPLLGEHTARLGELLGLGEDELRELRAAGTIGC
jgi:crotonobetainyl-CoA:carnitine CoA-transferase CaiB-like acyl-CoA transferase